MIPNKYVPAKHNGKCNWKLYLIEDYLQLNELSESSIKSLLKQLIETYWESLRSNI